MEKILINKNRGWRGLAEALVYDADTKEDRLKLVFSFSAKVWEDLMHGTIVLQDANYYYICKFNDTDKLPQGHQRSVLIKNFKADITEVNKYEKTSWTSAIGDDWAAIYHFIKNKNNHTQSDWNHIGIRVVPGF